MLDDDAIHRFSLEDVVKMFEAEILVAEDRVELLDGVLVDMTPPTPVHSSTVAWLTRHFVRAFDNFEVRVQDSLEIPGGFVVPDLMVIDPQPRDADDLPRHAHLVVEVSVTSQWRDRHKVLRYARAGISEYWIVDIPARNVFVHWDARPTGYAVAIGHGPGGELQPRIGGPPVPTAALLG